MNLNPHPVKRRPRSPFALAASVGKYGEMFRMAVAGRLAYLPDALSRVIFMGVVMFVFLQLWRVTYGITGRAAIGGLDLPQMIWYLVVTEALVNSGPPVARRIDEEVRSGTLAYSLGRPYSYPAYHWATFMGEATVAFVVNLAMGGLVAALGVGLVRPGWEALAGAVPTILLALTLSFLNQFAIGLLAFWIEDTGGINLLYGRVLWILGGLLLPVHLFPPAVRALAEALPFKYILYGPAHLFVDFSFGAWRDLVLAQLGWVAAFGAGIWLLFRMGVRRVHAHGG